MGYLYGGINIDNLVSPKGSAIRRSLVSAHSRGERPESPYSYGLTNSGRLHRLYIWYGRTVNQCGLGEYLACLPKGRTVPVGPYSLQGFGLRKGAPTAMGLPILDPK